MESAIMDGEVDAVIIMADDGIVQTCNPAAASLFGCRPNDIIGHDLRALLSSSLEEQDKQFLEAILQKKGEYTAKRSLTGLRRDGSPFAVELRVSRVGGAAGDLLVGILRDREPEQPKPPAHASEAGGQEQGLATGREDFFAAVGHEVCTHLNVIRGALGLLSKTPLNHEQRGFLGTADDSSRTLLTTIANLQDYFRIKAGSLELERETFDIVELVESVSEFIAPEAYDRRIEIATFISPATPRCLYGDANRLRQILLNLTVNAVKFTPKGGVSIGVKPVSEESARVRLRFDVEDSGPGILEAVRERLFDKPADPGRDRRPGSTGLGLVTARLLVKMMGGEIGCSSQPGQGSTVWFTVECARISAPATRPILPSLEGFKILLAETNPISRRIHEQQLQAWGMEVTVVEKGSDALAALQGARQQEMAFALALIDQKLPDIEGEQLGLEILGVPELASCRLILMTGLEAASVSARIRRLGFSASLTKPIRQFSLYLWLCIASGLVNGDDLKGESKAEFDKAMSPQRRILLAEDSQVSQIVITAMLEKAGYRAEAVSNGLEVLQALSTASYDLVLMDVAMPEMDGFETVIRIRQLPAPQSRVPVVAITADNSAEIRERCFTVGMNDCLTKPVEQGRMLTVIDRWLSAATLHSQAVSGAALDWQTLRQLEADTDSAVLDRAVGLFIDEATVRLSHIAEARQGKDWQRLRREAHALKSSAGTFGVKSLHQHALRLDEACRQGDWETALALAESIEGVAAPELEVLAYHYGHRH